MCRKKAVKNDLKMYKNLNDTLFTSILLLIILFYLIQWRVLHF